MPRKVFIIDSTSPRVGGGRRFVEVQLCVGSCRINNRGHICLTNRCSTADQVNFHFDQLIAKLRRKKADALGILGEVN